MPEVHEAQSGSEVADGLVPPFTLTFWAKTRAPPVARAFAVAGIYIEITRGQIDLGASSAPQKDVLRNERENARAIGGGGGFGARSNLIPERNRLLKYCGCGCVIVTVYAAS